MAAAAAASSATIASAEALCGPAAACSGFTFYPASVERAHGHRDRDSVCFRVGSLADKPRCDGTPTCAGTRCFEKVPGPPPPPPPPPSPPCARCRGAVTVFEPYLGGAPCWPKPTDRPRG